MSAPAAACAEGTQRREVLDHLDVQLRAIFGDASPLVFPLSAQDAMAARRRADADALAASGVPRLEVALVAFLVGEKRRAFLRGMADRIASLMQGRDDLAEDLARLGALRDEIAALEDSPSVADAVGLNGPSISPTVPACEICATVTGALFDFLAQFQSVLSGDLRKQDEFARRHGLCGPHTWQFEALAATREVCTAFAPVTERQAASLRAITQHDPTGALAGRAIENTLPNADACPACDVARRAALRSVDDAVRRLRADRIAGLVTLSAICMPHLRLLVEALGDADLVKAVLLREADLLDRLAEDMRHFALKRDGFQRHLTTKEEIAASERGLRVLVGNPRAHTGPPGPRLAENVTALVRRPG